MIVYSIIAQKNGAASQPRWIYFIFSGGMKLSVIASTSVCS
jgi:hypothetical protein